MVICSKKSKLKALQADAFYSFMNFLQQIAEPRKLSTLEDVTLDGYEAFSSGTHVDSTILHDNMGAAAKRGTLGKFIFDLLPSANEVAER